MLRHIDDSTILNGIWYKLRNIIYHMRKSTFYYAHAHVLFLAKQQLLIRGPIAIPWNPNKHALVVMQGNARLSKSRVVIALSTISATYQAISSLLIARVSYICEISARSQLRSQHLQVNPPPPMMLSVKPKSVICLHMSVMRRLETSGP